MMVVNDPFGPHATVVQGLPGCSLLNASALLAGSAVALRRGLPAGSLPPGHLPLSPGEFGGAPLPVSAVGQILTDPAEGPEYAATIATVAPGVRNVDNAAWIAATGPNLRGPLTAWLRATADDMAAVDGQNARASRSGDDGATRVLHRSDTVHALALARAILGETGETT